MAAFLIVSTQLIQFFLVIGSGWVMAKKGIICRESLPYLSKLITNLFLPAYAFYSTYHGNDSQTLLNRIYYLLFALCFYIILALLLFFLSKAMKLTGARQKVFQALFLFGNTGFIGMPLIQALYDEEGMVYMALFSIVDQGLLWSYGLWLTDSKSDRGFHIRNFLNPMTITIFSALLLILLDVQIPIIVESSIILLGRASTAACLIYLGGLLNFSNWKKALTNKELYIASVVKLLLCPLLTWRFLSCIGMQSAMLGTSVILAGLPTMTIVPMLAQNGGNEGEYAISIAMITLIFSAATLPLISYFALT